MRILADEHHCFILEEEGGGRAGELTYTAADLRRGQIRVDRAVIIEQVAAGLWRSYAGESAVRKQLAELKVCAGGVITLQFNPRKAFYRFRRMGSWKFRFMLLNREGDELLALLPVINWQKRIFEFSLQIDEEFKKECTPVLILHAVHCANCSLSMLNGGMLPALVSV